MRNEYVTAAVTGRQYCKNLYNGTVVYDRTFGSTVLSHDLKRDDVIKSSVSRGFRPPLPYEASGVVPQYPAINAEVLATEPGVPEPQYHGIVSGHVDYNPLSTPALVNLIPGSDISRATVNLLRSVGDSKWSAGEMLAEMQGSINLIGDSARKLSNAMLAASRKNWRGVAKALGVAPKRVKSGSSAASGWLEYQFGWAPVVSDIANSALFLSGAMDTRDPPILMARTRLFDSQEIKSSNEFSINVINGVFDMIFPYIERYVATDEWKASVYFRLDVDYLRSLSQYGVVGLSTPWAVMPMSHIADWVLPIGDVLQAFDALLGLTYLGGSYTRFTRQKAYREYAPGYTSPEYYYRASVLGNTMLVSPAERFSMKRTVWSTPPLEFPTYIKNPFDTFKAVTSVALLKQFSSKQ